MNKTNQNILIETDLIQELNLRAIAYLQKPALFDKEILDFKTRELNEKSLINITILNPSDFPLEFSFFLGPEEFSNLSFIKDLIMRYFGFIFYDILFINQLKFYLEMIF